MRRREWRFWVQARFTRPPDAIGQAACFFFARSFKASDIVLFCALPRGLAFGGFATRYRELPLLTLGGKRGYRARFGGTTGFFFR